MWNLDLCEYGFSILPLLHLDMLKPRLRIKTRPGCLVKDCMKSLILDVRVSYTSGISS